MKIRVSIILFCLAVAVLIVFVLWAARKTPAVSEPALVAPSPVISPVPATNSRTNTVAFTQTTLNAPGSHENAAPQRDLAGRAIGILSSYNDVPIDFFGRIQDQYSNAVSGAIINFTVRIFNGTESTTANGQVVSDRNGLFNVLGYKGQDLSLVPQKAGYALTTSSTLFKYSKLESQPFTSDPGNPTVIKMWKLEGSEPLFSINQKFSFYYTNTPISFDLLAGTMVPDGGDIQILLTRPLGIVSGRSRLDWGVQVKAPTGGLIEPSGNEFTFEAPAVGYQEGVNFIISTNAPYRWRGSITQPFFLKSRGGQVYSKIDFGILINPRPDDLVWVEFHGVANTNSSRNWEATAPQ